MWNASKFINKTALSLTDLLTAAILMGVVMLGVAGVNLSVKRIEKTSSQAALLTLQTATAMNHITQNGFQAIGTRLQPGIVFYKNPGSATTGNPSYFSFRQDLNLAGTPHNPPTPLDYSDDRWVIYTDAGIPHQLYTCIQSAAVGGPIPNFTGGGGGGNCSTGGVVLLTNVATINYGIASTPDGYFDISIETRADANNPASPILNPNYTLDAHINPSGHSWTN